MWVFDYFVCKGVVYCQDKVDIVVIIKVIVGVLCQVVEFGQLQVNNYGDLFVKMFGIKVCSFFEKNVQLFVMVVYNIIVLNNVSMWFD